MNKFSLEVTILNWQNVPEKKSTLATEYFSSPYQNEEKYYVERTPRIESSNEGTNFELLPGYRILGPTMLCESTSDSFKTSRKRRLENVRKLLQYASKSPQNVYHSLTKGIETCLSEELIPAIITRSSRNNDHRMFFRCH